MIFIIFLITTQAVVGGFSQKTGSLTSSKTENDSTSQNLKKLQQLLMGKLNNGRAQGKMINLKNGDDLKTTAKKFKSLPFHPFPPLPFFPFSPPPGYFYPKNDEIAENSYPNEWLSRTEPYRKNTPLLDSPTYYIRLPPSPYVFVPGLGYVSRPPSLTEPEVIDDDDKQTSSVLHSGNDILHDPFYRIPINFVANGKPTSVYQLQQSQPPPKPDSNLIHLDKGPYVFNGKPNEIYLLAQIYDALYGDELHHYYP